MLKVDIAVNVYQVELDEPYAMRVKSKHTVCCLSIYENYRKVLQ